MTTKTETRHLGFAEDSPFLALTEPELKLLKTRLARWYGRHPNKERATRRYMAAITEINDAISVHRDREQEVLLLEANLDVAHPVDFHRKDWEKAEAWGEELRRSGLRR